MADSSTKTTIKEKLKSHADWEEWFEELKEEAMRLGVSEALENTIRGEPHGIRAQHKDINQKFRNFTKALKDSPEGAVRTYYRGHGGAELDSAGAVVALLQQGGFHKPNFDQQRREAHRQHHAWPGQGDHPGEVGAKVSEVDVQGGLKQQRRQEQQQQQIGVEFDPV